MIKIQRGLREDGYYSEWMRTKNGEAAVRLCLCACGTDVFQTV